MALLKLNSSVGAVYIIVKGAPTREDAVESFVGRVEELVHKRLQRRSDIVN